MRGVDPADVAAVDERSQKARLADSGGGPMATEPPPTRTRAMVAMVGSRPTSKGCSGTSAR